MQCKADKATGANWVEIREFCRDLSLCPRGHFFYRDAVGFNVYCFADRKHAEMFCSHFDGEIIDPKDRPKWPKNAEISALTVHRASLAATLCESRFLILSRRERPTRLSTKS